MTQSEASEQMSKCRDQVTHGPHGTGFREHRFPQAQVIKEGLCKKLKLSLKKELQGEYSRQKQHWYKEVQGVSGDGWTFTSGQESIIQGSQPLIMYQL